MMNLENEMAAGGKQRDLVSEALPIFFSSNILSTKEQHFRASCSEPGKNKAQNFATPKYDLSSPESATLNKLL